MCGRFTLRPPGPVLAKLFDLADEPTIVERFNIAPTQDVAAVRQDAKGVRSLDLLRWGLVPPWGPEPGCRRCGRCKTGGRSRGSRTRRRCGTTSEGSAATSR